MDCSFDGWYMYPKLYILFYNPATPLEYMYENALFQVFISEDILFTPGMIQVTIKVGQFLSTKGFILKCVSRPI